MIFEIWSIGDPSFLWEILNSIAMVAGSNDLKRAVMIAMLLGVIVIGFQSVQQGSQSISLQKPILAWVIYMLLFGWTATANINDVYKGTTRSVANVPGGVVAVGSWISSIGYWMTEKFEQSFSLPKMTKDGFARDVDYVLMARSLNIGSADGAMGLNTSMGNTLHSYLKDCTAVGLSKGLIDKNVLEKSGTSLVDMKFNSSVFAFKSYLNPSFPNGQALQCDTGHASVVAAFAAGGPLDSALGNMLAAQMNVASGSVAYSSMQNALDVLVGVGKDSRAYIQNAIVKNMMPLAVGNQLLQAGSPASVAIMTNAIEKKRILEASEASLFMRYVHPLMTFMEGFIYALTPIIAVLVAVGTMGMSLAGKYLLMLLWIQLWMPVLAIVNLYLNMSVQGRMASLQDGLKGNIDPTSIMGQIQMHSTMADWLATAGTLAAATPALALMLVYGSAVTATHLAGRLGGNETVDPDVASPDPMKNRPVLDMASQATHSTLDGLQGSGTGVTQGIQMGKALDHSVQSAAQKATQSQHALTSQLSASHGSTEGYGRQVNAGESLKQSISAHGDETKTFLESSSAEAASSFSFQGQQKTDFKAGYEASIANGAGGRKAARAGVQAALGRNATDSEVDTAMEQYNSKHSESDSAQTQAGFAQALQHDVTNGKVLTEQEGWTKQNASNLSNAYSTSATDAQSYSEVDSARASFQAAGGGQTKNILGDRYYNDSEVVNARNEVIQGGGTDQEQAARAEEMQERTNKYLQAGTFQGGNEANRAAYAAAMDTAAAHGDIKSLKDLAKPTNLYMGGSELNQDASARNSAVGSDAKNAGKNVSPANNIAAPSEVPASVQNTVGDVEERLAGSEAEVRNQAAVDMGQVGKQGQANTAAANRKNGVEAASQIAHKLETHNGAEYMNQIGQQTEKTVTDGLTTGGQVAAGAGKDVAQAIGAAAGAASATDGSYWDKAKAALNAANESVMHGTGTLGMAKEAIGSMAAGVGAVSALIDSGSGASMEDIEKTFNEASMNYISENGGTYSKDDSFMAWQSKAGDLAEAYAKDQGLTNAQSALYGAAAATGAGVTTATGQNTRLNDAIEGVMAENKALFTASDGTVDSDSLGKVNQAVIGGLQLSGVNNNGIGLKQVKGLDQMLGLKN